MTLASELPLFAPVVRVVEPGRTPLFLVVISALEIGRDCTGLMLTARSLSRRHLALAALGGEVLVSDLGTTNGSTVDGTPLDRSHRLAIGETVRFGQCTLELVAERVPVRPAALGATPVGAAVAPTAPATLIEGLADLAVAEHLPTLCEPGEGTVTLVFSDITGSAAGRKGPGGGAWGDELEAYNTVLRRMLTRHRGFVVAADEDAVLLRFHSARRAVLCMCDVQRAHAAVGAAQPMRAVTTRAGIHMATLIHGGGGGPLGAQVHAAAAIALHARPGEVLVSSPDREIVEGRGLVEFGPARSVNLAALGGLHHVHSVRW